MHIIDDFNFIDELPEDIELTDELMMHFFYITSELMTNLLKHSHPNSIEMRIGIQDQRLILTIQHDGITLTQEDFLRLSENTENLRLENIRYRLSVIEAEILYSRKKNRGIISVTKDLN